jgi:hypothetical protein
MISIYDELSGKLGPNANRNARDGARRDLGLLLFAEREAMRDLWKAAARRAILLEAESTGGSEASVELRAAIEKLRPLFGERTE